MIKPCVKTANATWPEVSLASIGGSPLLLERGRFHVGGLQNVPMDHVDVFAGTGGILVQAWGPLGSGSLGISASSLGQYRASAFLLC